MILGDFIPGGDMADRDCTLQEDLHSICEQIVIVRELLLRTEQRYSAETNGKVSWEIVIARQQLTIAEQNVRQAEENCSPEIVKQKTFGYKR
jgi:hypothetical protein